MKGYKEPLFTPVEVTKRIVSIDILRGIAVFGILLMNIAGMGLPAPAYGDPSIAGGSEGWNLNVWIMNNLFFEGTMRAIFSMLFGAGFILLKRLMQTARDTASSCRRTLAAPIPMTFSRWCICWFTQMCWTSRA